MSLELGKLNDMRRQRKGFRFVSGRSWYGKDNCRSDPSTVLNKYNRRYCEGILKSIARDLIEEQQLFLWCMRESERFVVAKQLKIVLEELMFLAGKRLGMYYLELCGVPKDCRLVIKEFRDGSGKFPNPFRSKYFG